MNRILALVPIFAIWLSAVASAKPAELYLREGFSPEVLFAKLDSVGPGGTWMEWDPDAILDPEIAKIASDGKGKIFPDVEHGWLLENPAGNGRFAVLRKRDRGEVLAFYDVPKFKPKKVPLEIREPLDPGKVFRDYRETLPGHFVHLDDTNLQVTVRENEIQFSYLNPDRESLVPVPFFDRLPESRKQDEIRMRLDFYAYEYALMVRAFVGSTRGLFNWQIWHWLSKEMTSDAMIGPREVAAVLASPERGKFVRIFFRELSGGYSVEMLSNAHGAFLMNIRKR